MKSTLVVLAALVLLCTQTSCTSSSPATGKFVTKPSAAIVTKQISYRSKNKKMNGFLALPEGLGPFPGVLVVHEWWGQTDYPRNRARQLARLGYAALAVDMYGEGQVVTHPKDAKAFSAKVMSDLDEAQQNFEAALDTLRSRTEVNPKKIGAIGYCFGGAVVLEMARRGVDINVAASFHGNLTPLVKKPVGKKTAPLLIFNGAADPFVKKSDLTLVKLKLKAAKVRYKIFNYPGAKHGFTNPESTATGEKYNLPLAYNEKADRNSWQETMKAFKLVFKQ